MKRYVTITPGVTPEGLNYVFAVKDESGNEVLTRHLPATIEEIDGPETKELPSGLPKDLDIAALAVDLVEYFSRFISKERAEIGVGRILRRHGLLTR